MKKQIIKTAVLVLLATGIVFSCKKKDDPAPANTTTSTSSTTGGTTTGGTTTGGSTTGGGTTNTLQANSWTENGTVYAYTVTPSALFWYKDIHGMNNVDLKYQDANQQRVLNIRMANYLLPSGTYSIVAPTATLAPNTINISVNTVTTSPTFAFANSFVVTGGLALVTNQNGIFRVEFTNIGLQTGTNTAVTNVTGKMEIALPAAIPPVNASYTAQVGVPQNQFKLGANTFAPDQSTINQDGTRFKVEIVNGTGNINTLNVLKFNFSSSYPPSGTYDVVSSQSLVAPGKVFISFSSSTYGGYQSTLGGNVTVITDVNKVSVTANGVSMNRTAGTAGNQVETLIANFNR
jgi:hypothetical protein